MRYLPKGPRVFLATGVSDLYPCSRAEGWLPRTLCTSQASPTCDSTMSSERYGERSDILPFLHQRAAAETGRLQVKEHLFSTDSKQMITPLGYVTKPWVRRLAEYYGLPTAEREESMGLCFVGERGNFGDFICTLRFLALFVRELTRSAQYTSPPPRQGYLVDLDGRRLGKHNGLWYYTIGQGARLGGMEIPHFVAKKGIGESGQDILVVPGS